MGRPRNKRRKRSSTGLERNAAIKRAKRTQKQTSAARPQVSFREPIRKYYADRLGPPTKTISSAKLAAIQGGPTNRNKPPAYLTPLQREGARGSKGGIPPLKTAARSARTKVRPTPPSTYKTPAQLAALNARRKKTRNSWTDDPCVDRPNSKHAADMRHGNGSASQKYEQAMRGRYSSRKWC